MIELSGVDFNYQTPKGLLPAVKQVSLKVGQGEFVALLGANNAGKSTLCRLMAGLLIPQGGEINGSPGGNDTLRPLVGLVLANPEEQLVCHLVEEEIAFGLQNLGVPYPLLKERLQTSLELLGLAHLQYRSTHSLSGGEQQKVIVAALLALRPRCLILDEATSFLDAAQQQLVWDAVWKLYEEQDLSIVWSTSSVEEALRAKRVLVLHRGELVFRGSPHQLLKQGERIKEWGLVWPDLHCLVDKMKAAGFPLSSGLAGPEEIAQALSAGSKKKVLPGSGQAPDNSGENCPPLSPALIKVEQLTCRPVPKASQEPILSQVNFDIQPGEFLGISGHTGCGKSTLLQHLNGLLQPAGGRVCLEGKDINQSQKHLDYARRRMGMVFQYPERQFFNPSVAEEIAFGLRQAGTEEQEISRRAQEVFNWLGLDYRDLKERSPHGLSGGQRRCLAIACVLIMRPRILILDEPTVGLDEDNKLKLLSSIKRLHQQLGLTTIMVSHDLTELINLVQKLLILHQGKVYWQGGPRQLLARPEILGPIGLSLPPLWKLVYHLKQRHSAFSPLDLTVEGIYRQIQQHFAPSFP